MYGNILGGSAIERMLLSREIVIDPFEENNLGLAHYRLHIGSLYRPASDQRQGFSLSFLCDSSKGTESFAMDANEYLLVEVRERVVLPDGVFGRLVPVSNLVEKGFGLSAGKLDPNYGSLSGESQPLIVGIKNLLPWTNNLEFSDGIAHLELVDLRGAETRFGGFSTESLEGFARRSARLIRAKDDGPFY